MKRSILWTTAILCVTAASVFSIADEPTTRPADAETPLVIISREEWGSRPQPLPDAKKHVPKLLTIHHAGVTWKAGTDPFVSIRNLQSFSIREKNWPDVPYHYLIAPDGRVFEGRDVNYEPDTNTKYNLSGVLNIELMGNFEEQRVSPEQLRSLVQLISKLCVDLKLDPNTIRGHGDAAPGQTSCPGKDFKRYIENGSILEWVQTSLRGESPTIAELPELPNGPTTRIATTAPATPTPTN